MSVSFGRSQSAGVSDERFVAAVTIAVADVIAINASGGAVLADATFAAGAYFAVGAATSAAAPAASVSARLAGRRAAVQMGSAPSALDNGKAVYLSEVGGRGALVPPSGSGVVVYALGHLVGADGATTTPAVLLNPRYISRIP